MTADKFREVALSFPAAVEGSHNDHPDFRVRGKIFATLGYPSEEFGVLMLLPEHQGDLLGIHPDLFTPAKGAWGRRGSTQVLLEKIDLKTLQSAMKLAWAKITTPKKIT